MNKKRICSTFKMIIDISSLLSSRNFWDNEIHAAYWQGLFKDEKSDISVSDV